MFRWSLRRFLRKASTKNYRKKCILVVGIVEMNHDKVLWYDDWKIEELVGNSSKERWHKTPESLALCHPSILQKQK